MTGRARRRIEWWSAPALRLHAVMVAGASGALAAGWFEWTRARAGHDIAWVYVVEWPLFAVMGVYLWWRLLPGTTPAPRPAAVRAGRRRRAVVVDPDDPQLRAWQDYLARLHAADPPGRPPDG